MDLKGVEMSVAKGVLLLSVIYLSSTSELPPFVKKCSGKIPKATEECALGQTKTVLENLKQGYSPFDIPPLEPLVIPTLDLPLSDDFVVKMKDIKVEGLTSAEFAKFLPQFSENKMTSLNISLNIPLLRISGRYSIKGFLFIMAVDGRGGAKMEITNLKVDLHIKLNVDRRNDVEFYQLPRNFDVEISFDNIRTHFENMVPDQEMNDNLNNFMNENHKMLFEVLKPGIISAVRDVAHEIFLKLLMNVEVENFFTR